MAEKSLYEILEVSETASPEIVRAAYQRLTELWAPDGARGTDAEAALRYTAIREAFFTLGNSKKREAYDRRLAAQWQAPVETSFWTARKLLAVGAALLLAFGGYNHYAKRQEQARIEAQKAIAAERAKEEAARAEAERLRLAREANERRAEERQRYQRDADLRAFENSQRWRERENHFMVERDRIVKNQQQAREDAVRRREEQLAVQHAQQRAAREKAELCQLERSRYGRAISC